MYNIETSFPSIDPEFYEQHLKAIRDDERRVSTIIFLVVLYYVCCNFHTFLSTLVSDSEVETDDVNLHS